jgi:hypothetical protein
MKRQYANKFQRYVWVVSTVIHPLSHADKETRPTQYFTNREKADYHAYGVACDLSGTDEDSAIHSTEEKHFIEYRFSRLSTATTTGHFGTVTVTREVIE